MSAADTQPADGAAELVPERGLSQVVVGFDGSPAAEAAVSYAARRVSPQGHVTIVFAVGPAPELIPGNFDRKRLKENQRERGQALLDALLMEGDERLLDIDFDLLLSEGQPARAICDTAAELAADEIVIGTRRLGRARAALGSVSHEVLSRADRPVVVIPERAVHDQRDSG